MGIDLKAGGRVRSKEKKVLNSPNLYLKLLMKLFRFMSRRSPCPIHKTILRRLMLSRVNRPILSISRIAKYMKGKQDKFAIVISTVTNDERMIEVPKLNIVALKFTKTAKDRILKAGGQCLTLEQFLMKNPTGKNTVLLRGPKTRQALKYFGRGAGLPHSKTRPRCRGKGNKYEKSTHVKA